MQEKELLKVFDLLQIKEITRSPEEKWHTSI